MLIFLKKTLDTILQMASKSNQVARVMQKHLGLKRGDTVCVFMPNCGEYVWSWLGVAKLGAVSALINSNLRHKPLLHCIQVAKAKAIIYSKQLADGKIFFKNNVLFHFESRQS